MMEITLRTDAGLSSIERVSNERPEMCLGAGSIRKPEQIRLSKEAGATFCVSPGFTPRIIAEALTLEVPFIPGASTASEVLQLVEYGHCFVKFFPAELLGGIGMLKALSAPMPDIQFFPTGGISVDLALSYLDLHCVPCVGGSWFVRAEKIAENDFEWIYSHACKVVKLFDGGEEKT